MAKAKNIYLLPVPRETITQMYFGEGKHSPAHVDGRELKPPMGPFGDERKAADFYCPEGTLIFAAQDGTVIWVKDDSNEGGRDVKYVNSSNGISILHENGEFTNYLHLKYKGVTVRKGQKVRKGQVIGYVGTTGWTPAPHLHFSVFRIYGKNPFVDYETLTFEFENLAEKPKVEVYEGLKGIKTILEDVLETKQAILHYGDITSLQNALKYIFPQFINKRIEKKIPIKIICKKEEAHKELLEKATKEYREFKFIPQNYVFKSSIFIYNNKVAILSLQQEPYYGIIIDNGDFYQTQKNMFELLWQTKH